MYSHSLKKKDKINLYYFHGCTLQYAFLFLCNKVDHPLVLYKYLGLETTREEVPSRIPVPHVSKPSDQQKDSFRVKFLVLFYVLTIYLDRYLRVNALLCNVSLLPDGEKKHSMQFQERRSYVHAAHHTLTNHHNRSTGNFNPDDHQRDVEIMWYEYHPISVVLL